MLEVGQKITLSEFARNLADLGYGKVWEASYRGEFSQKGGIIRIFPINSDKLYSIEFYGNSIENISLFSAFVNSSAAPLLKGKKSPLSPSSPSPLLRGKGQGLGVLPEDYVVHIDHGIGIFRKETDEDFVIEYAAPKNRLTEPDLLYVPKKHIGRIQPYLGFKKPEIHRLGTALWEITKKRAKEDIIEFAKELIKILADRKLASRAAYAYFRELEENLEATFPHEDTEDQKRAIEEIREDLEKTEPMDRLLVGEVGFGKTEIAVRSAFKAVLNNKQVVILAPTTILADQHTEIFKKRLEEFGVNIARLTRLEKPKAVKEISKELEAGTIDIVIGTHKVLGKYLKFKNLGLLVIDEEQKFGVAQKEHFKKSFPSLDILALSATPIPRTLNMALSQIQPISYINTPPPGRQDIKTFVLPKPARSRNNVIKEAIVFELARGGQIYFLANRIHKIPRILMELESLKTKAKIAVLHGRMPVNQIIRTMREFREKKFDMLVSTTIIENGLDLSNANTLIVEDSTKLGLAESHQLRGRIGRGTKEGYAYFLYPTHKLKERAAERLEALERYSWLGAGIEIAKRDLEIRGCGNILGKAQSGVAYKIGLNLYFQLLEEAVAELKTAQ